VSPRHALAASALALLVLPAAASAQPGGSPTDLLSPPDHGRCPGNVQALYCADATADAALSCTYDAATYSCTATLSFGAAGWTASPLPGRATGSGLAETGVCDGISDCTRDFTPAGADCSWGLQGSGCDGSGSLTFVLAGAYSGCFEVHAFIDLTAYADLPGPRTGITQDSAGGYALFSTC
jgi:hypothetical protein